MPTLRRRWSPGYSGRQECPRCKYVHGQGVCPKCRWPYSGEVPYLRVWLPCCGTGYMLPTHEGSFTTEVECKCNPRSHRRWVIEYDASGVKSIVRKEYESIKEKA